MSSKLAMVLMAAIILTAAMAVPGDGPEQVSGEMEQGLDLRGEYEGVWWTIDGQRWGVHLHRVRVLMGEGEYTALTYGSRPPFSSRVRFEMSVRFEVSDKGSGKFLATFGAFVGMPGIYRHKRDRVILCFRDAKHGRPTSFKGGDGQNLLILHRVKPRK